MLGFKNKPTPREQEVFMCGTHGGDRAVCVGIRPQGLSIVALIVKSDGLLTPVDIREFEHTKTSWDDLSTSLPSEMEIPFVMNKQKGTIFEIKIIGESIVLNSTIDGENKLLEPSEVKIDFVSLIKNQIHEKVEKWKYADLYCNAQPVTMFGLPCNLMSKSVQSAIAKSRESKLESLKSRATTAR